MSASARAVIYGCAGLRLLPDEARFFAEAQPWGAILFGRNVESPEQLAALCDAWREAVGRDIPILIDQEGGRVQRLRAPHWRDWSPALEQCMTARDPARAMYLRGRIMAQELRAVGIDVNCAPLADIATAQTHEILRNRCYGTALAEVVRNARAMAEGLLAGGVLPVLKHIPGHGRATLDSHLDLPRISVEAETLRAEDFAAFRALADIPLGMTAHLVFEAFDPETPATQSPRMITLIREEIGFDGLLMTDDISMQALSGPVAARGAKALAAGCDLVLHCNGDMAEMVALAEICPLLSGVGLARSTRALAARGMGEPAERAALEAAYLDVMDA